MAAPSLSAAFQVGINIMNSVIDKVTGTILLVTGDVVTQTAEADNVELWGPLGYIVRPSKPQAGKAAAECITLRRGDRDIAFCARDQRGQLLSGNLNDGEVCLYAGGADGNAQARIMLKADGSVALLTTDSNTPTGKVVTLRMSPSELRFAAPWGSLVFDASGLHIKTKSGPTRLDMGGMSVPGLPSALTAPLSSYIALTAGVIRNVAANVFNGAGAVFFPAVASPALPIIPPGAGPMNATQLAAINTFAGIVASQVALIPSTGGSIQGGVIATAAIALATALAAAPQPVQSQTVWNAP